MLNQKLLKRLLSSSTILVFVVACGKKDSECKPASETKFLRGRGAYITKNDGESIHLYMTNYFNTGRSLDTRSHYRCYYSLRTSLLESLEMPINDIQTLLRNPKARVVGSKKRPISQAGVEDGLANVGVFGATGVFVDAPGFSHYQGDPAKHWDWVSAPFMTADWVISSVFFMYFSKAQEAFRDTAGSKGLKFRSFFSALKSPWFIGAVGVRWFVGGLEYQVLSRDRTAYSSASAEISGATLDPSLGLASEEVVEPVYSNVPKALAAIEHSVESAKNVWFKPDPSVKCLPPVELADKLLEEKAALPQKGITPEQMKTLQDAGLVVKERKPEDKTTEQKVYEVIVEERKKEEESKAVPIPEAPKGLPPVGPLQLPEPSVGTPVPPSTEAEVAPQPAPQTDVQAPAPQTQPEQPQQPPAETPAPPDASAQSDC